jgi:hypothetical protein
LLPLLALCTRRVRIWKKLTSWRFNVIPPRFTPPGILQLLEVLGDEKKLLIELPTSSKNRDKINRMRNDMLMVDPTKTLVISENNAYR